MQPVTVPILARFEAILEKRAVAPIHRAAYKKWLSYFWISASNTLSPNPDLTRQHHLHETHVQDALYVAVRRAKLTKRVTSHTFRHPATGGTTHLLQANYDIRTIQTLLGHSDVRTTMIYTHCIPSKTVKEAKSPLKSFNISR
jgi:site-specific recombinase XerD